MISNIESSDAALLADFVRTRSGDAFARITRRHGRLVFCIARRKTTSEHDAADVTQAVFVALAQKAGSIDGRYLSAWLVSAAFNAANATLRAAYRRARREKESAMDAQAPAPAGESPEQQMINAEIAATIDAALLRLGDVDRAAVIARCVHDEPFGRIGNDLGISEEAARKRVDRALLKLRQWLGRSSAATDNLTLAIASAFATDLPTQLAAILSGPIVSSPAGTPAGTGVQWLANKVGSTLNIGKWIAMATTAALIGTSIILWPSRSTTTRPGVQSQPPPIVAQAAPAVSVALSQPPSAPPTMSTFTDLGEFIEPPLLKAKVDAKPNVMVNNMTNIKAVRFLADGKTRFVAGGTLNRVGQEPKETYTGRAELALRPIGGRQAFAYISLPGFPIEHADVTPDGSRAIFTSIEWNTGGHVTQLVALTGPDAGKSVVLDQGERWCPAVAISPDGQLAAAISNGRLIVWDANSHKPIDRLPAGTFSMQSLCFSPSSRLIACGDWGTGDTALHVWSIFDDEHYEFKGARSGIESVAFSPDNRFIAWSDADGVLYLRKLDQAQVGWKRVFPAGDMPRRICFSPDGQTIATAGNVNAIHPDPDHPTETLVRARLFDVQTGQPIARAEHTGSNAMALAFAPDGQSLLADCSTDTCTFALSDFQELAKQAIAKATATPPPATQPASRQLAVMKTDKEFGGFWCCTFSADDSQVLAGTFNDASIWKTSDGSLSRQIQTNGRVSMVRPDLGVLLAIDNTAIALINISTGQRLREFTYPGMPYIDEAALSADGSRLALAGGTEPSRVEPRFDPEITLWDTRTGRMLWKNTANARAIMRLCFSPDGKRLLAGGGKMDTGRPIDCEILQLNVDDGSVIGKYEGVQGPVRSLVFCQDGKSLWAGSAAGPYFCFEFTGGKIIAKVGPLASQGPWSGQHSPIAVSPDGKLLAAGFSDSNVYLYDTKTGKLLTRFTDHDQMIMDVQFSHDGKRLLSCDGKTIRLWNVDGLARP